MESQFQNLNTKVNHMLVKDGGIDEQMDIINP